MSYSPRCPITYPQRQPTSPHPPIHYLLIHSHSFFASVILLLSQTHQSLVPSFFPLSFQTKTILTLVVTMTHRSRLPPYPIYSAQCPRPFAPCVSSITPLFPSSHPSSQLFQQMTTSLSSLWSLPLLICIISSVFLSLGSKPNRKLLYRGLQSD